MDETTKILIGTISGFVIAFLAEPVKSFFAEQIAQKRLRRMLYHEIYENYTRIKSMLKKEKIGFSNKFFLQRAFQKDGYEYARVNEIKNFYQLREAIIINRLYLIIKSSTELDIKDEKLIKNAFELYVKLFEEALKNKEIDKNLLTRIAKKL